MASPYSFYYSSLPSSPALEPLTPPTPLTTPDRYSPIVELFGPWNSQPTSPAPICSPNHKNQLATDDYPSTAFEDLNRPLMSKKHIKRIKLNFRDDFADVAKRPLQAPTLDNDTNDDKAKADNPPELSSSPKRRRRSHAGRSSVNSNEGTAAIDNNFEADRQTSVRSTTLKLNFGRNQSDATTVPKQAAQVMQTTPWPPIAQSSQHIPRALPTFSKSRPVTSPVKIGSEYDDDLSDEEGNVYLREREAIRKRKARKNAHRKDMIQAIAETQLMEKLKDAEFVYEEVMKEEGEGPEDEPEGQPEIDWEAVD